MLDRAPTFAVIAVPSENQTLEELSLRIQKFGTLHETTRLIDQDDDLGDCFLFSLELLQVKNEDDHANNDDLLNEETLSECLHRQAQVWVTSCGPLPLAPPYGWKDEDICCHLYENENGNQAAVDHKPDVVCEKLQKHGVVAVIQNHHPAAKCNPQQQQQQQAQLYEQICERLWRHVDRMEAAVRENHPHIELGVTPFGFVEYTHRGEGRFEVLLDACSDFYSFLKETLEPLWIDTVNRFLHTTGDMGTEIPLAQGQQQQQQKLRLNISCVYSRPGSPDQDWHTDGAHLTPHDRPYAVCIFVPLIPLTAETGYTRFWPKSHVYSQHLLGLGRAADAALQATWDSVGLQCGDYVMYHYETWHKGVANTSQDCSRPILQFLYSCDWYKERRNYGETSVLDAVPPPQNDNDR